MDNKELENVGFDKDFVDEHGETATMHIEPMNGYKGNLFNNGKYKLVNAHKKNNDLLGVQRKNSIFTKEIGFKTKGKGNIFTKDIGIKSSGFAQVASLAFIIAIAGIFVLYLLFRY